MAASTRELDLIEHLSRLARERSSEKRRELLGQLTDLYFSHQPQDRSIELELLFAGVVQRLLQDIDPPSRATYAASVARSNRTPRQVAMWLAMDQYSVSEAVLRHSPSLHDSDLISIVHSTGIDHRAAIASRANITAPVTDALIKHGELSVAKSIVANETAEISVDGFERLSGLAETEVALQFALSQRGDLPRDLALRLLPLLDEEARTKLQWLLGEDSDEAIDALIDDARRAVIAQKLEKSGGRIHARAVMAEVRDGQLSLAAGLERIMMKGGARDVALALSIATNMPEWQLVNALVSVSYESLALICKALGITSDLYVRLDHLRTESVSLPDVPASVLQSRYSKLDPDAARKTLRFAKVRNALEGSQSNPSEVAGAA